MERGNIAHHYDNNKRNGSVMWSTMAGVARPPHVVFLRGDVRWSPTADVARPPCVVLSQWRLRGSLQEIRIRWFHSVRWSVVVQRHYSGGSCIAVAVQCSLLLSVPCRRRPTPRGFSEL